MKKKAFEMGFNWMFAIIAGGAILFLAIYGTSQFIKTRNFEIDSRTSTQLSILLDPLNTGIESGKSAIINFGAETTIFNDKCYTSNEFGEQSIGVSSGKKLPSYGKPQYNKYIFSEKTETGKEFVVFSVPFEMPFKIGDLIIFSEKEYCFVNAPEEIEDKLKSLGVKNANFNENCSGEKVCFGKSGCEVAVYPENEDSGYIVKGGKKLYYSGNLLYGAIFASPEIYECNAKRLMLRLISICKIYKDEIKFLSGRCNTQLDSPLNELISLSSGLDLQKLSLIKEKADETDIVNEASGCRIW